MQDHALQLKDRSDAGDKTVPEPGRVTAETAVTGSMLPSVAALPEAFERNPNGGEMVAWLFVAWLVYRVIVAWINSPRRR